MMLNKLQRAVLREARDRGVAQCPVCHVPLNYSRDGLPNSARPTDDDHVICARCQRRGESVEPVEGSTPDFTGAQ